MDNEITISILISSLKRLYENNKISRKELFKRVSSGKITQKEFDYIVNN